MKEINLGGKYSHLKCILDDDWAEMFRDGDISIMFGSGGMGGYAFVRCKKFNGKQRADRVHSVVMDFIGSSKKLIVDHINGNKLDNRKENLRIVTQKINSINKNNRINSNNSYGIRGLSYNNKRNLYSVNMVENGRKIYNGFFENKNDAIAVATFNNAIREL